RASPKEKGGPEFRTALSCFVLKRLALRELEAAASLGPAVLLALDHAAVAGQEAFAFHCRAERRLEARQRLGNAVLDRAGLSRQAAALDGGDDVILTDTIGDAERLVDHQAQRRTSEIDRLIAAVELDLAGARLQADACNSVLAAAGRIGAAIFVELLLAQRGFDLGHDRSGRGFDGVSRRSF